MQRFWSKVDKTGDCWNWTAGLRDGKYGGFQIGKKNVRAHRQAWELTHGPVPDGLCVLHKCDNTKCVNPDHLFLGTVDDNNKDRHRKGRTVLPRKLCELDVWLIRELLPNFTQQAIADWFGVSRSCIREIKLGNNWAGG